MHLLVCSYWEAWAGGGEGGEGGGVCGAKEEKRGSGERGGGRSRNRQRYVQAIIATRFNKPPLSDCLIRTGCLQTMCGSFVGTAPCFLEDPTGKIPINRAKLQDFPPLRHP